MERLEFYRQCIRKLLEEQTDNELDNPEVECQLVFDSEHDRYQILDVGWEELKRIYYCFIHIDIKEDKIWIQRNMTETDIAAELVAMGIAKEDIIALRKYVRTWDKINHKGTKDTKKGIVLI